MGPVCRLRWGRPCTGLCAAYERAGGTRLTLPRGDALKEKGERPLYWSGWQEGAILTAWSAVITIDCQRR